MNTWPNDFPCPQTEGWSEEVDLNILTTAVEVLPGQHRSTSQRMPTVIDMTFVVPQALLAAFLPWCNTFGYTWFKMPLPGWLEGINETTVRFIGGMQKDFFTSNGSQHLPHWKVRLQAEIAP